MGYPMRIDPSSRGMTGLLPADRDSLFGYMRGTLRSNGDVIAPLEVEWNALSGDEDHLYRDERFGFRSRPKS